MPASVRTGPVYSESRWPVPAEKQCTASPRTVTRRAACCWRTGLDQVTWTSSALWRKPRTLHEPGEILSAMAVALGGDCPADEGCCGLSRAWSDRWPSLRRLSVSSIASPLVGASPMRDHRDGATAWRSTACATGPIRAPSGIRRIRRPTTISDASRRGRVRPGPRPERRHSRSPWAGLAPVPARTWRCLEYGRVGIGPGFPACRVIGGEADAGPQAARPDASPGVPTGTCARHAVRPDT